MLLPVSSAYEASRESKAYSAAKADLTRSADIKVEYHRINDVYDIKGGDTHVIFFEDSQHILYYDQHGQNNQTTDQVSGEADGDRLSLAEKFDASTQTWKLIPQPNGSYHIQSCSGENRYLNMDQVNGNTDKVPVGNTPQEMIIAAHDDGFSIKREDRYLHHEQENQFYVSNQPASFHIYKRTEVSTVKSELDALIAAVDTLRSDDFTDASVTEMRTQLALAREASKGADEAEMKRCTKDLRSAMQALEPKKELLAPTKPDPHTGMTQKEPFPRGISGNLAMRIPALITLNDGSLAAAIDARWDYCPDGEAIDTLFSISEDNGETWTYSYPNYFNDSTDYANSFASALIDPVMVQGKDDTLYLMVDVLPGGTPLIGQCADDTGYRKIGDKMRMVLYTMADGGQTDDNWSYYVGDFVDVDGKAYAPVIQRDAAADELNEKTDYWLDDHYYLYTADKKPMYCPQLGIKGGKPAQPGVERGESIKDNGKYVHESVFFYNAELHVRRATYLWLTTSDDNGKTWSAPTILNPQVRPEDHTKAQKAYIVGPGAGLCLDDGTIMLTCYTFSDQDASFIYKKPGENIWHRSDNATSGSDWSSESVLIQLNKDTVRHFYRDGVAELRYTDHTRNPDTGEWKAGTPVTLSGVVKATNNQLSALLYSKKINGKPVILVSTATVTTPRSAGRIYSFNVEENGDMTLLDTYHVNRVGPEPGQPDSYSYSSLTELDDGRIGLLYEDDKRRGHEHAAYVTFTMEELMPNHQMLDMRPGEQKVIQSTQGSISKDFDQNVIDVKVRPTVEIEGGQGRTGTTASYDGAHEALATALYKVTKKDGIYQFAATTKEGTKVWANNQGNPAQIPTKTSSADWTVTAAQNGQFNLKTDDGYLYFYTDRQKNYFDRVHSIGSNQEQCEFSLYRPAMQGDNASEQVPGFVQTTQVDEIKDGERYLIAAERNGEVYVMRPSSASSADDKFDHVLKVDPTAKMTNTVLESEVVLTAKANGTTQVEIDKVTYHITVANPSHPDDSGTSSNDVVGRETIINPDGSVTVTEIRRDGTVIKTPPRIRSGMSQWLRQGRMGRSL